MRDMATRTRGLPILTECGTNYACIWVNKTVLYDRQTRGMETKKKYYFHADVAAKREVHCDCFIITYAAYRAAAAGRNSPITYRLIRP